MLAGVSGLFCALWAEGPVEVHVLYRPLPGADVGWQGPIPRMDTEPSWPLCPLLPPCQADMSTQHFSFWFVLPVCAGGSAFPGAPGQALTVGHKDRMCVRQTRLPQAKITTCGSLSECVHAGQGAQGQVQVSLDLPGMQHMVWGQALLF